MKKLLAAVTVVLAILACSCTPKERTVEFPVITAANTTTLDILKVELNDSATVLHLKAFFRPGWWIRIAPETHLRADGKTYALISADDIIPGEKFSMPESGEAEFALTFEPLPVSTKRFDFIEGDDSGAFHLWGIDLTGKAQPLYPDGLPDELKKEPEDGELPGPILEIGTTTVNIHLLNWTPEQESNFNMYVNTMAREQDEYPLKLDENGKASVTFNQCGSAKAVIAGSGMGYASFWLAPGEVIDVYVDMRLTGDMAMSHRDNGTSRRVRQYTNGKYQALNAMAVKSERNYTLQIHTGTFADYHMTGDEYFEHVMGLYKAYADSISSSGCPQMIKELELNILKQDALRAILESDFILEQNYRRVHNNWNYREPVPTDSIKADITDAHIKALFKEINPADEKLMMMVYDNMFYFNLSDWDNYDIKSDLPKSVMLYCRMVDKAKNGLLAPEDIDLLKTLSNPFFAAACDSIQQWTVRGAARFADSDLLAPTPDVAADKVFDSIIAPHKGKVVLVDLWNTWCGPCRAALRANEPLKDGELKNDDIVWIYIADESSPLSKYMSMIPEIKGIHYRVNEEQIAKIQSRFNVDGIPYYILVDRNGKATGHPDFRDHNKLRDSIKEALK